MHENNLAFVVRVFGNGNGYACHSRCRQDIAAANIVYSWEPIDEGIFKVPQGIVYFIDFGSARLLPSEPGTGIHIYDWSDAGGHYDPPEGEDVVDPYAYDIYSLGRTLEEISDVSGLYVKARCNDSHDA